MAYSGPFQYGDRVQLTDTKRRHYTVVLQEGGKFHSHKGIIEHDLSLIHISEPTRPY